MKRLDTKTLSSFLETAGVAVVMFGAEDGKPTMHMAEEFALLWADVVTSDLAGVFFGYADGSVDPVTRRFMGVNELPALLIVRNGEATHRFEGFCSREAVLAALRHRAPNPPYWWRTMACETEIQSSRFESWEALLEAA
jgi:hypothetical protein